MAITFGVMLHVDRGPAAVVPPLQPAVEGAVVPQVPNPVLPVEGIRYGQLDLANDRSGAQQALRTYDFRGKRHSGGDQSGAKLDLFA